MVNLFSCDTLEVLELLWDSNLQFDRKAEALEFLNKQENLLELKLGDTESEFIDDDYYDYTDFMDDDDYGHDFFSTPNLEEFKPIFSLEKFSFTCTSLKFERHAELILFLNSQKNTLQSLSLSLHAATIETIEKIQKFVLEKLLKVTKLGFFINVQDDFRSDSEPMNNDEPNHATAVTNNINEFRFRGLHRSLDENKRFIDKFENLKHLYLRAVYRDDFKLLDYISITKLNLVSLKLDRFDASFEGMPRVYFPKLKTLFIGYFEHNVRNWTQRKERIFNLFIQKHDNTLEEISIKFNSVSKLTIEAIIGCRRLKCLEFHCDEFVETKSLQLFMKVLEDVPCKLPKLTLKLPGHSFVFPDDERFWDKLYPKPPVPVLVKNFFKFMLHVVLFVMFFRFILKPISLFLYEFILARI
ncbi:unnamed protein product [Chironomus riparius]|uniref:Uncharacterized protein n=1 Tax=Chironomus riparius TaxID=315576 RepID=A0A9N9S3B1_9DIPT|nr:unnamed protein product [Chironomus riparius]